jgi:hypothetical protein
MWPFPLRRVEVAGLAWWLVEASRLLLPYAWLHGRLQVKTGAGGGADGSGADGNADASATTTPNATTADNEGWAYMDKYLYWSGRTGQDVLNNRYAAESTIQSPRKRKPK